MTKGRHDHKSLTKNLIDHFSSLGLEIQYADYDNYQKPFVINRHAPDVIAFDRVKHLGYIGKAKMCTEIEEPRTKEQFNDFARRLMRSGISEKTRLPFYIAIPRECNSKTAQVLKEINLNSRDNIHVLDF
ncbi:MAG: hypothetical protein EB150_07990 [Nitrososphaeria archaeon]|nr:hypothetical protein [Nitrososphaeria archaeon]NDB51905.1 hypothetical protein [Nitrosopumilaceae archaeon]NDB88998.1 hypothetical protein [Nitrososphaerota archaeon]NDB46697.1 hypothetical protein [Nitrososphaeria archaeon]NDB63519.1 hypothetical protein [Nitrosopumilaceae archaeon]